MEPALNVFGGEDSVRDFMNPGNRYLPLVELPEDLNPFFDDGVRIFAKLMTFTSFHNVKVIPAFNMLAEADERGELDGVTTVIENSSGNTISAVAVAARSFGIDDIRAIVPDEVSWHKLRMLRFLGISPIVNQEPAQPDRQDPTSGIYKAKELGKQDAWFNPGQYSNPDNPRAHRKWTGPQIWEQTDGKISVFCDGLGTTGTIIGTSEYLKDENPGVQVVGVMRAPDSYVPGPRTKLLLRLIGFDWKPHVDSVTQATTPESYGMSMELSRSGLYVGPSSGLSLVGLIRYLEERKESDTLDELRNADGEVVSVFICPDTPMPYFDEYFKYLDDSYFPEITNEEFLKNSPGS
ncbi:MAG: pyridoxal-phosphate dependent enzyme [Actinomycetota bacterium]|nr:pyridoxal-phosphate dependent enzyme [Actinomycetota bacterium]